MFVNLVWKSVYVITVVNLLLCDATPASSHIHTHHHEEREEDGGYSPRDKTHIVDGHHHSEFDHEAILGMHCVVVFLNFNS
jgi:hypothetical protein